MKTSFPKPADPKWYIVDAADKVLGRLSAKVARALLGKHEASYVPHWICAPHIIIVNAEKVKLTGAKVEDKTYYRHTGYFGHLRSTNPKRLLKHDPTRILELAVKGMLPRNGLRDHLLKRLHIYAGVEHNHANHQPTAFPL